MATVFTACTWDQAGTLRSLDRLPAGLNLDPDTTDATISCVSLDGSIKFGYTTDETGIISPFAISYSCRWDGTTITLLDQTLFPDNATSPVACTPDGSLIIGTAPNYWIDGGTTGIALPNPSNFTVAFPTGRARPFVVSDDGSIIVCNSDFAPGQTTYSYIWTNFGNPTLIDQSVFSIGISPDGSTIVGYYWDTNGGLTGLYPAFWRGGVIHKLPPIGADVYAFVYKVQDINGDGSRISGFDPNHKELYWDNLTTLNGDGTYGTPHYYDVPSLTNNFIEIYDMSLTNSIGVGNVDATDTSTGARWDGTSVTVLPGTMPWPTGYGAFPEYCSADGSISVGNGQDIPTGDWLGVWWDLSNSPSFLQPSFPTANAEVDGISRDGSIFWGRCDLVILPGTNVNLTGAESVGQVGTLQIALPRLTMDDLVVISQQVTSDNHVSLRWSDTRGASWASAVQQTLGERGRYDVDVSFRRLGMSRDRVWELSWATTSATALTGAFVQFELAAT